MLFLQKVVLPPGPPLHFAIVQYYYLKTYRNRGETAVAAGKGRFKKRACSQSSQHPSKK
jgi:hypothetical protein